MSALPEGWAEASLADLPGHAGLISDGDWIESKDQDPDGDIRLIQLMDIGDGAFRDRSRRFINRSTAERLNCTFLEPGDVLIARMPDPLGRACIFPGVGNDAVTAVDVLIWRGAEGAADPQWLKYAINSPEVRAELAMRAGGTTRQRIAGAKLKELRLPVPPLAEQRRIVAKLDALTARTARARADLDRIPHLAARYKQAVLNEALNGSLTRAWRASHECAARRRVTLGSAFRVVTGMTPSKGDIACYGGGVPFAKPGDLDLPEPIRATRDTLTEEGLHQSRRLPVGTVLVSCIGNLGKVGILAVEGSCNQQINAILPSEQALPEFVLYWAQTLKPWLEVNASATTIAIINKGRFLAAEIDLPDLVEQAEIVHRIETAFAEIDRLAAEAAAARRLLDRLDQAVLVKAFRGELVPQDPTDEPASALLARIAGDRDAPPRRRGRRTA